MSDLPARRMLLVHAHPDDESIANGATMARYAGEGALVTLVTCTRGEEGEVVVPDLEHHASHHDDTLGEQRVQELADACAALGVRDHRFLGGAGRWRDSGMMGTPTNDAPDCFWRADLAEPTAELVAIMREVRPQVVIAYDENGGYGHPDHIQAHRVAVAAFEEAADAGYRPDLGPAWEADKLYYGAIPKSVLAEGLRLARAAGIDFFGAESVDDLPFGTPDELVTTEVDGRAYIDAKHEALRAYVTQISVNGPFFALADGGAREALGVEYYILVRGKSAAAPGQHESDVFAGIA